VAAAKAEQSIDYRSGTPDVLRDESRRYQVVCALEVVEHVPDRPAFLRLLSALVRPGGLLVISTIDRTLLARLVAIVGGETILGVMPKGTHRWDWFVRPQEAQRILGREGMVPLDLRGHAARAAAPPRRLDETHLRELGPRLAQARAQCVIVTTAAHREACAPGPPCDGVRSSAEPST
jgi:ubiquinone biosynthesis O-methyltransferase